MNLFYAVAAHLLMLIGGYLLSLELGLRIALAAWCLVEGAALFGVSLMTSEGRAEPEPWHHGATHRQDPTA